MLAGSGLDHLPDDHAVLPDDGTDGYVESGAFAVRTQAKKYIEWFATPQQLGFELLTGKA